MEYFLANSSPPNGTFFDFIHVKANTTTTNSLAIVDTTSMAPFFVNMRFTVQNTTPIPPSGTIYCATANLNTTNPNTIAISNSDLHGNDVNNIYNWDKIQITDIANTVIYQCTVLNVVDYPSYLTMQLSFNNIIGTPQAS